MKSKTGMALMGLGIGVGSAALYTNIKNGNMKKLVRKMNSAKTKAISDLENMMQEEKIFLFFVEWRITLLDARKYNDNQSE